MMHFIFDTMFGWWGVAGLAVAGCIVVGYFIPSLRLTMLAIAGVFLSSASIYSKGNRDRAALEKRRRDAAVKKAQDDYADIENRPDTPASVSKRLRDGSF